MNVWFTAACKAYALRCGTCRYAFYCRQQAFLHVPTTTLYHAERSDIQTLQHFFLLPACRKSAYNTYLEKFSLPHSALAHIPHSPPKHAIQEYTVRFFTGKRASAYYGAPGVHQRTLHRLASPADSGRALAYYLPYSSAGMRRCATTMRGANAASA